MNIHALHPRAERVYVSVTSDFDSTGYMHPRTVTWNGHTFDIDSVSDFRPSSSPENICTDCYTVVIHGQTRHLFFERTDPLFGGRIGRWFVEVMQ